MMNSEKLITKKDLYKMAVNQGALGMEFSWNYERQMNVAFCLMMNPILKKIYHDDFEGYKDALIRHTEFFNITPQAAPFVGGVCACMEELKKKGEIDGEAITGIKTALMGPLSGIGDSIFIGCIRIVALGIGLSLSLQGNILGPIIYFLIYNIPAFICRFYGARLGYDIGFKYLSKMKESGMMDKVLLAASILGIIVIGAMSKDMVYTKIALTIGSGETAKPLQEILDGILPGIVGLSVTWLYYYLLNKKISPMILIVATIILCIIGKVIGLF